MEAGVPCIPGYHGTNQKPDFLRSEASKIGFPVLIKAVKGGGGKGMRLAMTPDVFDDQLKSAKSEAMSSFGDEVMLVEKYISTPRHIEVQIFADKHGMFLYILRAGFPRSGAFCHYKIGSVGNLPPYYPLNYPIRRVLVFKENLLTLKYSQAVASPLGNGIAAFKDDTKRSWKNRQRPI